MPKNSLNDPLSPKGSTEIIEDIFFNNKCSLCGHPLTWFENINVYFCESCGDKGMGNREALAKIGGASE